ncbi:MAG: hypothetical protein EXS05_08925 [Planctomycetaceae bacterium]|nr:hypothetical protein [Planctomycetaceae bacterium]
MRNPNKSPRSTKLATLGRSGLTRLEVFVVIAVFGMLAALLLPATYRARESARQVQMIDNMRLMGVAIHSSEAINGRLPGNSTIPRRAPSARGSRATQETDPRRFDSWTPER